MKYKGYKIAFGYCLFIGIFSLLSLVAKGEDAPVTTIASVIDAAAGEEVTVPIIVSGFENIGGLTLALNYDYSKLHFISGTKNPLLTGTCSIGDIDLGNGFHRLTISWFKSGDGISLPDSSSIVDYVFTFISGPASLTWYEIGPSCVYNDPKANTLNDIPTSDFYFNGVVSDSTIAVPGIAVNGPITFFEGDSVTLTSSAGFEYLWSTGDTTSSIVAKTSGSYTVQTINTDGISSESSDPIVVTVISPGNTKLSFRLINPRIVNSSFNDYFEFDVQIKADVPDICFWKGQINLDFNTTTFSSNKTEWTIALDSLFKVENSLGHVKYKVDFSTSESTLNIEINGDENVMNFIASENDFVKITTDYQTIISVKGKINSEMEVAGISFDESMMEGKQYYKISTAPWYETYAISNNFDFEDFADIYVSRIFSMGHWSQIKGVDWTKDVNTSVWDKNAVIPEDVVSLASNLRIHESANLSVPENAMMTVSGNTEIKNNDGLIIHSDSVSIGSFITSSSSGQGSAVASCFIKTNEWHAITSPFKKETFKSFLAANSVVRFTDDNSGRNMKDYNPELNSWSDCFVNDREGDLEHGKGYFLQTDTNCFISFNGSLQAGDIEISGAAEKWNCIGNPYTSAIKLNFGVENTNNFLSKNIDNLSSSFGAVYIWNQPDVSNGNVGSYSVVSNAVEAADIQQGQAFFVKLNEAVDYVNFTSNMQIHKPELALKSIDYSIQKIELNVSSNFLNTSTIIVFKDNMTLGLDPTYDAGLLKGNTDLMVYSKLVEDNGVPFAIQALPNNGEENLVISLGLDFKTGGDVIFSSESFNLPLKYLVLLEDRESGIITDLSQNDYSVQIAKNSSISDRFRIHTAYITTGSNSETLSEKLIAYATHNKQVIIKGNVSNNAFAMLYDLQGRILLSKKLRLGNNNVLNVPDINSGIYLLIIRDNYKIQSFKIPVSEY